MTGNIVASVNNLKAKTPNITWQQIAEDLGMKSGELVRGRYRRQKQQEDNSPNENLTPDYENYERSMLIEFMDKKTKDKVDWRELVDLAVSGQQINNKLDNTQRTAEVHIHTDLPIAITFTGDWHLGDGSTDHKQWTANIQTVLENDRLFMIDLGDDRQNARTFRQLSVVLSQVLSPKQQAHLMRSIVDELTQREKLLAKVSGNHDNEWDQRIFGEALQGYLLENMNAPYFDNRGLLKLHVGDELYTLLLFHKSRFRSFMRGAHGAYREYTLGYPADIVAGGHDHLPAFEIINHFQLAREADMGFGGLTYLVKCGTYQDSDFGWKYFHNGGRPINITIVLWPGEHHMQAFTNMHDALRFINTF